MTATPLPRPRQVSFSGWSIVIGSVLTILFAFQRVAALGSLEAQQAAADFISTPPGDGLGLSVDDVQTAIRVMCLIAGGTAAATAILGWHVMAPSRSARVVLSLLAPVLFVAGLTSGGLFSALVAVGVAMLWAQPARDYFDGKAPVRDGSGVRSMAGGAASASVDAGPQLPSGPSGQPASPAPPAGVGSSWGLPAPGAAPAPRAAAQRPGGVTAAAVITIVASSVTFVGLIVSLVYIASNRADFLAQVEEQMTTSSAYDELSASAVADVSLGFLAVLAIWCVAAIVLAVAVLRGSNGARIALIASAVLSGLVSLIGVVVVVPLALTVASIATVVLLLTGGSGEWFASRKRKQSR